MNEDQVYTNARGIYEMKKFLRMCKIDPKKYKEIVDPSAGGGELGTLIPFTLQMDIDPKAEGIIKQDFFGWKSDYWLDCLIITSPPFGKDFELGKRFLKHAAENCRSLVAIVSRKQNVLELESLLKMKLCKWTMFNGKCFTKNNEQIELNHLLLYFERD